MCKYLSGDSDAQKKNAFDVERYMKRRPVIVKPDEPFGLYEPEIEPENEND